MAEKNTKELAADALTAVKNSRSANQLPAMATTAKAQMEQILEALQRRPHNSYELRRLGCYQCPTRVHALRQAGYRIITSRLTVIDQDGYFHTGVALYTLLIRPDQSELRSESVTSDNRPCNVVQAGEEA